MLTRQITIAGNPNITHTLYFDSRSNAGKAAEAVEGRDVLKDDYGQTLTLHPEAVIISDLIQDGMEMLRAQSEGKIMEIKAQARAQKRFESDAELTVLREAAMRRQAANPSPSEQQA